MKEYNGAGVDSAQQFFEGFLFGGLLVLIPVYIGKTPEKMCIRDSGYIDKLQANKNKLDVINQTIRKYNQALLYCRQDNEDMAIIQLKKVLIQNPRLIKAYHLLSLLYLKRQEYEKARKLLKKAAFIDATNTTTCLLYTSNDQHRHIALFIIPYLPQQFFPGDARKHEVK